MRGYFGMEKRMKEKVILFCGSCLFLAGFSAIGTAVFQHLGEMPLLQESSSTALAEQENHQAVQQEENRVKAADAGLESQAVQPDGGQMSDCGEQAEQENVEECLVGILANQITTEAPIEAIKAQAVIARTEYFFARQHEQPCPQTKTKKELQSMWSKSLYARNYEILERAVSDTRGEVLTADEKLINAAYHAVSNGRTRTMTEGMEQAGFGYLKSVSCQKDSESSDFLHIQCYTPKEIVDKLKEKSLDCGLQEEQIWEQFQVVERDASDYVLKVQIGEQTVSGDTVREWLSLDSDCFYLSKKEKKIRIITKGLGHGFGLSQYTAAQMAAEGEAYQSILQYFFHDVAITKINETDKE